MKNNSWLLNNISLLVCSLITIAYQLIFIALPVFAENREFTLTVTDSEINLDGTKFMVWKYNDAFPGPEIRVKEGDTVRVKLRNKSSAKHGLFFHGLFVNPRVSMQEQEIFVDPGYEYTYGEFIAKPAGTHLYHCSFNMAEHISRGLYGAFIVEAKDEPKFDKEFVYILSDWDSKSEKEGEHHGIGHPETILDNDITTINDRAVNGNNAIAIEIREGEKIRLRLANIGTLPHTLKLQGGFIVAYEDGYLIPEQKRVESFTMYPGKTNDFVITADKPGKKLIYHSIIMPGNFEEKLMDDKQSQYHHGNQKHNSGENFQKKQQALRSETPIIMINAKGSGAL